MSYVCLIQYRLVGCCRQTNLCFKLDCPSQLHRINLFPWPWLMQLWVWSQAREPLCSLNLFDTFWNSQDTMVANKTLQAPVKSAVEWHMPHRIHPTCCISLPVLLLFQLPWHSSGHPCAHTFEHFIEATFGIKIATTPHLTGLESETYSLVTWSQKMSFIYLPTVRQVISIISNQLMSCEWMDFSEKSWTTNTSTLAIFYLVVSTYFFKLSNWIISPNQGCK